MKRDPVDLLFFGMLFVLAVGLAVAMVVCAVRA